MTHSSEESPEWFAIVRESFRAWGASSYQKPNGRRSRYHIWKEESADPVAPSTARYHADHANIGAGLDGAA